MLSSTIKTLAEVCEVRLEGEMMLVIIIFHFYLHLFYWFHFRLILLCSSTHANDSSPPPPQGYSSSRKNDLKDACGSTIHHTSPGMHGASEISHCRQILARKFAAPISFGILKFLKEQVLFVGLLVMKRGTF
jgi:hypothetical protein